MGLSPIWCLLFWIWYWIKSVMLEWEAHRCRHQGLWHDNVYWVTIVTVCRGVHFCFIPHRSVGLHTVVHWNWGSQLTKHHTGGIFRWVCFYNCRWPPSKESQNVLNWCSRLMITERLWTQRSQSVNTEVIYQRGTSVGWRTLNIVGGGGIYFRGLWMVKCLSTCLNVFMVLDMQ